jgi:hypothetical protein
MALTERQKIARRGKLTGSRVAAIMSGDAQQMYDLWLELTGDPEGLAKAEEENQRLANQWHVLLGSCTEPLHLDWLARSVGEISERGKSYQHEDVPWALVTLDGWAKKLGCAVEAKHVGGFEGRAVIEERYMPQMHWTMYCTGTEEIMFSVIAGAKQPAPVFIKRNELYMAELVEQAALFMKCVFDLREPVPNPYIKPPKPEYVGIVNMSGNNLWATAASRWTENLEAHKAYEFAAKEIKAAVPVDAKEAFGHGIRVKRAKNGSLTIKPENDDGQDEGTS